VSHNLRVHDLNAWFGSFQALHHIHLDVPPKQVTAVIGPSGCGKSTFVRCLNRMHETLPGARISQWLFKNPEILYPRKIEDI
jgi:phosphate transport system ATP-binding protein